MTAAACCQEQSCLHICKVQRGCETDHKQHAPQLWPSEEEDIQRHHQHTGTQNMTAAIGEAAEVCQSDRGLAGEEDSLTCWTLQTAATSRSSICSRCRAPFWGGPWSSACCSLELMPPPASQKQQAACKLATQKCTWQMRHGCSE